MQGGRVICYKNGGLVISSRYPNLWHFKPVSYLITYMVALLHYTSTIYRLFYCIARLVVLYFLEFMCTAVAFMVGIAVV